MDEFELQIEHLIEQALRHRQTYEQEKHEAEEKLREVDAALVAYDRTLDDYRKHKGVSAPSSNITAARFRSITVGDGMEAILRETSGKGRLMTIARRLLDAGKLTNRKTMYSRVRGTALKDKRFEVLKGGWVRLVEK